MSSGEFHWEELNSAEVVARLEYLQRSGLTPVSDFLDIHQWLPLDDRPGLAIDGGYPDAQLRRVALGQANAPLAFHNIQPESLPPNARAAHGARVVLGKACGRIGRIGDVAMGSHLAVVAEPGAIEGISEITAQSVPRWSPPDPQTKRVTAAANRIDAVVAAAYQLSRDEAQTALKYRFIFVNFAAVTKRTTAVRPGDVIIFRAKGKVQVRDLGHSSRSGRCWLEIDRLPV